MTSDDPQQPPAENPAPRRRRQRYAGTHPRHFDERYKELDPSSFPDIQQHVRAQGRTPAGTHISVLLSQVMETLKPQPGDIVADCTLGYGGHALEFLQRIGSQGCLIGLDVDAAQLERTSARLTAAMGAMGRETLDTADASQAVIRVHRSHFAGLGKVLTREGIHGCDILFADLGVSSMQIDDPARGFSYKHDGLLDMRMDDRLVRTAADFLVQLSSDELAHALTDLADEPDAKPIAESVVRRRAVTPITRTGQLVDLVFDAKKMSRRAWRERPPEQRGQLHPAAKTFQALRVLVNDELSGLAQFLRVAPHCLNPGGRLGVISFHSGEDRRVDESFREGLGAGTYSAISEMPIRPSPAEIAANPRSRSALFRWAIKSAQ
jgi:16S rRNA (cytosine1402-N4)-methyltransferase